MMLAIVGLIVGFGLLIKGGDALVDGASSLARRWGVSLLVIGLTVVAFGTSAPELIVNIIASAEGEAEIAIGNVVGSNIANILLVLGLTAIVVELRVRRQTVWKEIPLATLAVVVLFVMVNDVGLDGFGDNLLSRGDGIIFFAFFAIFVAYTFFVGKREGAAHPDVAALSVQRSWAYVLVGLTALVVGGRFVVGGASEVARFFGVSEAMIGLTVVAVGTSLPELMTSVLAARKGRADIAVGNVVGSNIFNVFFVLGVSATIRPLPVAGTITIDVLVALVASMLLLTTVFVDKRSRLRRWEGWMFVLLYGAYLAFLVVREVAA